MTRDETMPAGRWEFDAEVTDAFDDMLARSIPDHDGMRETVRDVATRFADYEDTVLDIGASRGEAIAALVGDTPPRRFIGLEVSEPMVTAARERFAAWPNVEIRHHDLRTDELPSPVSVALSVLTLQFTPIEYRHRIISAVHRALEPGGALVIVEKVLGGTADVDELLVDSYYDLKRAHGYTDEQIDRKRLALEGVLVPVTAAWNGRAAP